ncbi:MAG: hypothetical protein LBE92_03815 [Chryseobacterium sp.]|jgi:hypothetical protein|uniref:hypothetical protein n=1 Tax=Chryseobacterium sp. TaxID=1871047 RepID=UPI0028258437|nr:hypothetical protein [Chryseobacterium sp.]MDR2235228.1 hypothetical protein [Chryseobacterium sp.]
MKFKLYFTLLLLAGISLFAQNNYYWIGGTGTWNDLNHWRIGSPTGQQATIIPSRYDNVYITSGSGFSASGGTISATPSIICKDFIIEDSFTGKLNFSQATVFNIYGNLRWRGNVGAYYNITMNLYSDSSNPSPNLIDIPANLLEPAYVSSSYSSSITFSGTGSFRLVNDFSSNGYFSFNIGGSTIFQSDNKNIRVTGDINYSSTAVSDFGSSQLTSTSGTLTFNPNINLTQATVSGQLSVPSTQDIKNIIMRSQISVGTYLKADQITGTTGGMMMTTTGSGQYEINTLNLPVGNYNVGTSNSSTNITKLKVNTLTTGSGSTNFYASENELNTLALGNGQHRFYFGYLAKYNINHLILNGGDCLFNAIPNSGTFNVNQTITSNLSCKNTALPVFGGVNNTYFSSLVIPAGINGGSGAQFKGYTFYNVKVSGGAAVTASIDGGGNTGPITYTGLTGKTYYRIGAGAWDDPLKWSFSSGGAPASCVPTMYDDVVFDANSGFTAGNNVISNPIGNVAYFRNMTWNNAPGNPVYAVTNSNIYGSLYFQKEMTAPTAVFNFQKFINTDPPATRYMNFEGQTVSRISIANINDDFRLLPASWAAPYDVNVSTEFSFNEASTALTLVSNLSADGTKIWVGNIFRLGGKTVSVNNALIRTASLYVSTAQAINAPNTSVYISTAYNGKFYSLTSSGHFFGSVYKEGTPSAIFSEMKTNLFQINAGNLTLFQNSNTAKNVNISAPSNISFAQSSSLTVTDTFLYPRADCDLQLNFNGNGGNNLILGNNINGTGLVTLNRMLISGINAVYVTPVAGAKPVNANNSVDNGNNSGINFTLPAAKNFYWKGGNGAWNDLSHWSLDPSPARTTANCGLPTIYDNVFFDQYSGFSTTGITAISLDNHVQVNNLTFSGLPVTSSAKSHFAGNSNYYSISINGDLTLHPGYYDAGYFSGFTFINDAGKAAGLNKAIYPNGANSSFIFTGNASWKVYRGTGVNDMISGAINQTATAGPLDLTGTILNLNNVTFSGKEVLLSNSDISARTFTVNTQQPVISNNSILRMSAVLGGQSNFSANNLPHYFERIDYKSTNLNTSSYFTFQGGLINHFNMVQGTFYSQPYPLVINGLNVNHLNIEKSNYALLSNAVTVNKSMLIQGGCVEDERVIISGDNTVRPINIPNYNSTDFIIDRAQLKNISSSGGQTYITSNSKNLGNTNGFSFSDMLTSAPRDLYWIGGQGDWNDPLHWSLSSGGTPITGCNPPRSNDNVFFDQNSGFTASQKAITIGSTHAFAHNVTFSNAPNTPNLGVYSNNNSYYLNIYGNLVLQSDMTTVSSNSFINMQQGPEEGRTRYIDTKGVNVHISISANKDYFELMSPYLGNIGGVNVKGFKSNNHPMTGGVSFNYSQAASPVLDFGQSAINTGSYAFSINSVYPVTVYADGTKITSQNFTVNIPTVSAFNEVTITGYGTMNNGTTLHSFNKVTFLGGAGTSTLASAGRYKTLYFNPGTYTIAGGQIITENLFMTGTPCNRINISRTATSGQSLINLDPAAVYTMFYASVRDMNFSRAVSAYGNSQDLGNTSNLTIVPTNVQAAGFGGNKTLCSSEFPKTYDAATLFGTDANASYIWTKLNAPGNGVISTSPLVTFTQPGNYTVKVVYAQDGCNITENFTVYSVTMPADNTATTPVTAVQQAAGDVQVKFRGSLAQTYIFTYSVNNGPDQEITSAANGEAVVLHPKNQAGTFVYRLKSIRFASGTACPLVLNNKDIIVTINPECPVPGVTMLMNGVLRGCTAAMGARRLAELEPVTVANPPAGAGITQLIHGTGITVKEGNDVFMIRNLNALPETLVLPAQKPHAQGAVIFHNDHFYEGVENGKWIRIDNE